MKKFLGQDVPELKCTQSTIRVEYWETQSDTECTADVVLNYYHFGNQIGYEETDAVIKYVNAVFGEANVFGIEDLITEDIPVNPEPDTAWLLVKQLVDSIHYKEPLNETGIIESPQTWTNANTGKTINASVRMLCRQGIKASRAECACTGIFWNTPDKVKECEEYVEYLMR